MHLDVSQYSSEQSWLSFHSNEREGFSTVLDQQCRRWFGYNVFQFLCPNYVNLALTVQEHYGGGGSGHIVGSVQGYSAF